MLELLLDPILDVGLAVANVSADSESGWSFSSVSPLVGGPDRHIKVSGELLDRHELVVRCHSVIVWLDPVHGRSRILSRAFEHTPTPGQTRLSNCQSFSFGSAYSSSGILLTGFSKGS